MCVRVAKSLSESKTCLPKISQSYIERQHCHEPQVANWQVGPYLLAITESVLSSQVSAGGPQYNPPVNPDVDPYT